MSIRTQEENYGLEQAKAQMESIKELVAALSYASEAGLDTSYDEAQQAIQESPLSVQVRSGWHTPGAEEYVRPEEFEILLCTGGPAVRIVGDVDEYMQPYNCCVEYQDWGTPWTPYAHDAELTPIVQEYCQQFYFGE